MRFILPALALTIACGEVPNADVTAPEAAPAPAVEAPAASADATAQAAPAALPASLDGDWKFELNEAQQARVKVLRMALGEAPPTASELAAANLDGVAANDVDTLLAAREADPNAPEVDMARNELKSLEEGRWQLKDGLFQLMVGDGAQEGYVVQVDEATDNQVKVTLMAPNGDKEQATFEIVSDTKVVVHRDTGDLVLNR